MLNPSQPQSTDDQSPQFPVTSARITLLRREQLRDAGKVLAASHVKDPAYGYLFPDPEQRVKVMRAIYTELARDALPFGAVYVAMADGQLLGAAIWLPPGRFPLSLARKLRGTPTYLSIFATARRSFPAFMGMGIQAERAHPQEPIWYLEALGVDPQAQGGGLGPRLLEPVLARTDSERLPCYLETANYQNLGFYERLGFHVEEAALPFIPQGPTHWTMRRPPAGVHSEG